MDDGHKMRVKVLAKEIDKGIKALNALHTHAYNLYVEENSLPDWVNHSSSEPADAPDTSEPTLGAESFKDSSNFVPAGVRQSRAHSTEDDADEDIIDLKLQRQVHQLPLRCKLGPHNTFLPEIKPRCFTASNPSST